MGISGRIAEYFLRNSLTPLIALIALLLGVGATLITPREEEPQINVTMANVFVPFPGASARDVEALVTRPAEQVLSRIAGIEHVYSVSRPGLAVITVQYKVGEEPIQALVRLYDTINSHRDWLSPSLGVMEPIIKPKGIDDVPIVTLTFHSADPGKSAFEMQQVARATEIDLKRIPGTRDVATIGGPGHVIRVVMDVDRMNAHGIAAQDLKAALQVSNASQPAGSLVAGNREVLVQTGTYIESAADVKRLVVGVFERKPVYLADVAEVVDGADQPQRYVWHGERKADKAAGQDAFQEFPAVTLSVSKKPGVNAADVAEAVIARAEALKGTVIPEGVEFTVTRNYGATATDKAQKLIGKLVFATAFVVLLVLFALGRREAVIVGAAVTLTLAATLFASWAYGFTLNRVSLFALIFSIGILVDDAIVVVENIHRHQHLNPEQPLLQIIPRAVDEVGGPTILATATVIAALLPMAFVTGLMGPYMSPIPINSSLGMALSLAIAFTVTPWLAARLMRSPAPAAGGGPEPGEAPRSRLSRLFESLLRPLLMQARRRWMLWAGILAAMALSVSLALVPNTAIGVVLKMLPFDNKSEFALVVEMPAGTPLEDTAAALQDMAAQLSTQPEVEHLQGYAGTASPITFNGLVRQYYLRADAEQGDLQVNLVDKKHRHEQSHAIAQRLRPALDAIAAKAGARLKVVEVPPGPPVLAPLVAEVYGPDEAGRIRTAEQVLKAFGDTAHIVGIDSTLAADAPRAWLRINRQRAETLGIPVAVVAQTVNAALSGADAGYLHDGQSKYPVPVRLQLPAEQQVGLEALLALPLRAGNGQLVPLSELVRVERGVIDKPRYTKDLQPLAYVLGDVGERAAAGDARRLVDSPLYGLFAIRAKLAEADLGEYWIRQPSDPFRQYALKWDGEWQITYETFRDMGAAYGVGLILIYLLVVAQFRSYLTPLVIMAPIPLTVIGVMPGHALLGAQFTATSMIGMIALAGIIVRNSILLVDFIELQLAQGLAFKDAVVSSAAVRAQPIALTGLAAMIGAFFILDDPIFNGLAVSLIFGIFVSTLLTLVVIPVLYYALYRRRLESPAT